MIGDPSKNHFMYSLKIPKHTLEILQTAISFLEMYLITTLSQKVGMSSYGTINKIEHPQYKGF